MEWALAVRLGAEMKVQYISWAIVGGSSRVGVILLSNEMESGVYLRLIWRGYLVEHVLRTQLVLMLEGLGYDNEIGTGYIDRYYLCRL